jgi:hypothetical protein
MNLLKESKVTLIIPQTVVGTTTIVAGTPIDMSGFDGVMFVYACGGITDGTPSIKVSEGAASNMSDRADLLGSGTLAVANTVAIVDVFRPVKRYVDCSIVRGGSTGSIIGGVIAIQYKGSKAPTTQPATVNASKQMVSPAEGTA